VGDFHLLFFASFPGALRVGSKAVLTVPKHHFRSSPINGHRQTVPACRFRAKRGSQLEGRAKSSEAPIRTDGYRTLGARSAEFRRIFASDLVDLVLGELLSRQAWRIAGFSEKAVQARRRDNPEQQEFLIGIREPVPGGLGNEYRSTPLRVRLIIWYECSAAFQDVEGFVHLEVSVDRDARANRDLLGSQSEIAGAFDGVDLDEDVARIAEVNETVAAIGTENVSLWRRCLSGSLPLRQRLADADHGNLPGAIELP
jgi:hypothetical protein